MTAYIYNWATSTIYKENMVVIVQGQGNEYDDKIYRCIANHTSFSFQTDYGNSYWELLKTKGIKGDTGDAGLQGAKGDTGATGATGASGADGNDGIFAAIATQGEAESGVDNTKGMTPLRVVQSIDQQLIGDRASHTALAARVTVLEGQNLESRVSVLEGATGFDRVNGKHTCQNNLAVADDIDGDVAGEAAVLTTSGTKSARIHTEIYRKDDAETRFTTCVLLAHFIPGLDEWRLERESTTAIVGNPDGVSFEITTTEPISGVFEGQLAYTTDNMAGGNYDAGSYIKYTIYEISDTY